MNEFFNRKTLTDKCIIIDIDQTLFHIFDDSSNLKQIKNRDVLSRLSSIVINKTVMYGITRDHLDKFIVFCFRYFKVVGIWSAGSPCYVNRVVHNIFKGYKPDFVFTSVNTEFIVGKHGGLIFYKPLSVLFRKYKMLNKYNTLILDDRIDIAIKNKLNIICIPEFAPNVADYTTENIYKDDVLLKLIDYFNNYKVINETNVLNLEIPKF
jgi:hypothetical protein